MKSQLIVLTCVLTAAACSTSNSKPAQYPSSGYTPPVASGHNSTGSRTTNGRGTWSDPTYVAPSGGAHTAATSPGTPDHTKNVDNTKVNERDRGDATLTPMDQGNSGSETQITAAIRRGIMGDNNLSFTAKNVKVITVGTKVTLRGPVKSNQEKAVIEALAKQTAGVREIDNQLEVKM